MILEQGHRIWRVISRLWILMFIFGWRQNWVGVGWGCLLFCIRDGPGICDMFGGVSLLLAFWVSSLDGNIILAEAGDVVLFQDRICAY